MSTRQIIWTETEFHDSDLMSEVKRIMLQGTTGQIVLNVKGGRVMSVVLRERSVRQDTNQNLVDTDAVAQAFSQQ
jgi:hypothetical protein